MQIEKIDIAQVTQFSTRDRSYYLNDSAYAPYIEYGFDYDKLDLAITAKQSHSIDRALLVEVLKDQYHKVTSSEETVDHINSLSNENTFTVVTAHQPSLLTGPLYYVFKILSAIKVSARLKQSHPDKNFVPVFIIGGEDHDYEEINHLHLYGKTITWQNEGIGSVSQFSLEGIEVVLNETLELLGERSKAKTILTELKELLPTLSNYGEFSFRLTHRLFDHLGLVILRMGDAKLKKAFSPIITKEIVERPSQALVVATQTKIEKELGFSGQAYAREINFFYINQAGRNRIEYVDGTYKIIDTKLEFSEAEITNEIKQYPERFSPNVIMRPIYQEFILPNLAYIGGGGELAYWIERKSQFAHFNIPFPMLIRRQSGMIMTASHQKNIDKLGLNISQLFSSENELVNTLLNISDQPDYKLTAYKKEIETLFDKLAEQISSIDVTLARSASAEKTKAHKSIDYLESKVKKALKQKEDVNLNRMRKLKTDLFPKGLQERHDNIFQYISTYGEELINQLLPHCDPFDKSFKVFKPTLPS